MSRHTLHSEENFWPCVSDMFLALFVIALVLYASASKKAGEGELQISDQLVAETLELVDELSVLLPAKSVQYTVEAENLRTAYEHFKDENKLKGNFRELALTLKMLSEDERVSSTFKQEFTPIDAEEMHSTAVEKLYAACGSEEPATHTGSRMRVVRRHITRTLAERSSGSKDDALETIKQLQRQLKERIDALAKQEKELQDKKNLITQLERQIKELQEQQGTAHLHKEIDILKGQLEKLKDVLYKDTRGLIMKRVDVLLDTYKLRGKVEIKESEGIIRIPSSSVAFGKMDNTYHPNKIIKGKEVLQQLADLLEDLTQDKETGRLIESIVIEGHADPGVRNKATKNTTNEIASSERATLVWFFMNGTFDNKEKLQHITNYKGLSMFSHAGLGDRVPLERDSYESENAYNERCRRIDIRFIAAPIQEEQQ